MADEAQQTTLKQGTETWNRWRAENAEAGIDLVGASLRGAELKWAVLGGADLIDADLGGADLRWANLSGADLSKAVLNGARLGRANLSGAHLSKAVLAGAGLVGANLNGAWLDEADLSGADLSGSTLSGANLGRANLAGANLTGARLAGSDLAGAVADGTVFAGLDLGEVSGLEDVVHRGPSQVSADTFARSKGEIPAAFLRGCGLSDADIEYAKMAAPDLDEVEVNRILRRIYELRVGQAAQTSPLFISCSDADAAFVARLEGSLNERGVRYWRNGHEAKAGRLEKQIDRAMRLNPTWLLVLSESAIGSDWVEAEVRTARVLGKELGRDVLCPVALDDSWKSGEGPERVVEQVMEYDVLDFSGWEDESEFEASFRRLMDGLGLSDKR
jgi:uncharacterized protein YjbI with pentapeptide repeats